jgi:predicted phosphoribosyltransferase
MTFRNRKEAGEKLASALSHLKGQDVVVVAIPRGGVVVGDKVARALDAPLDVVIPRKIGAPANPELAIGSVVDKERVFLNQSLVRQLNVPEEYLNEQVEKELAEIKRRRFKYLGDRSFTLRGKTVVLVDDGLATGYTALAALRYLKSKEPKRLVLAVPVAPRETIDFLKDEADEIVCLASPAFFYAVGQFYSDFRQVSDEEVVELLSKTTDQRNDLKD